MITFELSRFVHSPADAVFAFLSDPLQWPQVWPGLVEVSHLEVGHAGLAFRYVYKMAGMRLEGDGLISEAVPSRRLTFLSSVGVEGSVEFELTGEGAGTRVGARVSYGIPVPLLGRFREGIVRALNEHEAEAALANLDAVLAS